MCKEQISEKLEDYLNKEIYYKDYPAFECQYYSGILIQILNENQLLVLTNEGNYIILKSNLALIGEKSILISKIVNLNNKRNDLIKEIDNIDKEIHNINNEITNFEK